MNFSFIFRLLFLVALMHAPLFAAPLKWGPGCDAPILKDEFSLAKAPAFVSAKDRQAFIARVIGEMERGYGGTMVTTDPGHPHLDTPEFVAAYLRAFADPGDDLKSYDYRSERLLARLSSNIAALDDPRLDWDIWRAWLLYENKALASNSYRDGTAQGSPVISILDNTGELLWLYFDRNATAIQKDAQRRAWWMAQLTRDLEADGGRPARRWFLLKLISTSDPQRRELEKVALPEPPKNRPGGPVAVRRPHPLDPFLVVTDRTAIPPPFADALWQMASNNGLSLEIRGLDPDTQPPTAVHPVTLEISKWPTLATTPVIHQESWSDVKSWGEGSSPGADWGVHFWSPVGRRANYANVNFPRERRDGVFFFVYQRRLYVWPKAEMDRAAVQMARTAGFVGQEDEATEKLLNQRGLTPLKVTLERER